MENSHTTPAPTHALSPTSPVSHRHPHRLAISEEYSKAKRLYFPVATFLKIAYAQPSQKQAYFDICFPMAPEDATQEVKENVAKIRREEQDKVIRSVRMRLSRTIMKRYGVMGPVEYRWGRETEHGRQEFSTRFSLADARDAAAFLVEFWGTEKVMDANNHLAVLFSVPYDLQKHWDEPYYAEEELLDRSLVTNRSLILLPRRLAPWVDHEHARQLLIQKKEQLEEQHYRFGVCRTSVPMDLYSDKKYYINTTRGPEVAMAQYCRYRALWLVESLQQVLDDYGTLWLPDNVEQMVENLYYVADLEIAQASEGVAQEVEREIERVGSLLSSLRDKHPILKPLLGNPDAPEIIETIRVIESYPKMIESMRRQIQQLQEKVEKMEKVNKAERENNKVWKWYEENADPSFLADLETYRKLESRRLELKAEKLRKEEKWKPPKLIAEDEGPLLDMVARIREEVDARGQRWIENNPRAATKVPPGMEGKY